MADRISSIGNTADPKGKGNYWIAASDFLRRLDESKNSKDLLKSLAEKIVIIGNPADLENKNNVNIPVSDLEIRLHTPENIKKFLEHEQEKWEEKQNAKSRKTMWLERFDLPEDAFVPQTRDIPVLRLGTSDKFANGEEIQKISVPNVRVATCPIFGGDAKVLACDDVVAYYDNRMVAEPGKDYDKKDARFGQQMALAVVHQVHELYEKILGRKFNWKDNQKRIFIITGLSYLTDSGYLRGDKRVDEKGNPEEIRPLQRLNRLQMALSWNVKKHENVYHEEEKQAVSHEATHLAVDSDQIRPLYMDTLDLETEAFQEGHADTVQMFLDLRDPVLIKRVLEQTGGDLSKPNDISDPNNDLRQVTADYKEYLQQSDEAEQGQVKPEEMKMPAFVEREAQQRNDAMSHNLEKWQYEQIKRAEEMRKAEAEKLKSEGKKAAPVENQPVKDAVPFRSACNDPKIFRKIDWRTLPLNAGEGLGAESHSYAQIWSGAWYDALKEIYNYHKEIGNSPERALADAGNVMGSIAIRQLDFSPVANPYFNKMALAELKALKTDFHDSPHYERYRKIIEKAFIDRGILTQKQINDWELQEKTIQEKAIPSLDPGKGNLEKWVKENAAALQQLDPGLTPEIASKFRFDKTYSNDKSETFFNFVNAVTIRKDDLDSLGLAKDKLAKYKEIFEGRELDLNGGLTLGFDSHGKLFAYNHEKVSPDLIQDTVDYLAKRDAISPAKKEDKGEDLRQAAGSGNIEDMMILLNQGADINAANEDGFTPLMEAADNGHIEAMKFLLEHNAKIDALDTHHRSVLVHAAVKGQTEAVEFLAPLTANVDVTNEKNSIKLINVQDGNHSSALTYAAEYCQPEAVIALVKNHADVQARDINGASALTKAAISRQLRSVEFLADHGAEIDAADNNGWTALHHAASNGWTEIAYALLDHDANAAVMAKDGKTTPVFLAMEKGNFDLIKPLVEHEADASTADKDGVTLLMKVAEAGEITTSEAAIMETMRTLAAHGAKVDAVDNKGWTALMRVAARGGATCAEAVKFLVEGLKAKVDAVAADKEGSTAVKLAVQSGDAEVAEVLLQHGADPNSRYKDGLTLLMRAVADGHVEVVKALLKHKAEIDATVPRMEKDPKAEKTEGDANDKEGWTALLFAASSTNPRASEAVQLLAERGANVHVKDNQDRTALMKAADSGLVEGVKALLERKAEINAVDNGLWTALMYAARKGSNNEINERKTEVLRTLLEQPGIKINARDKDGRTALKIAKNDRQQDAVGLLKERGGEDETQFGKSTPEEDLIDVASSGDIDKIRALAKQGADVNALVKVKDNKTGKWDEQELRYVESDVNELIRDKDVQTALMEAADHGQTEAMRVLVELGARVDVKDNKGRTAVFHAASNGHIEAVKFLVDLKAQIDARDNDGATPVVRAAEARQFEVVKFLVDLKADVNARDKKDGATALIKLAGLSSMSTTESKKLIEAMNVLLEQPGIDVDARDNDEATALMRATEAGNIEAMELLLEHHAKIDAKDSKGKTALMRAAEVGNIEAMELLKKYNAEIDATDNDGITAFLHAASTGRTEAMQLLAEKHKANVHATDNKGWTALFHAANAGQTYAIKYLVGDLKLEVNIADKRGWTPAMVAADSGKRDALRDLVVEYGATDAMFEDGSTVLMKAAEAGETEVVQTLVDRGANVDAVDKKDGRTALMKAASEGRTEIAEFLAKRVKDINASDSNGWTALFHAASAGHAKAVKVLLDLGADPEAVAKDGKTTALDIAKANGQTQCVKLLEARLNQPSAAL